MDDYLPQDPYMLVSSINMMLRDQYPDGLEKLCQDKNVDIDTLKERLKEAGFEYSAENNRFW